MVFSTGNGLKLITWSTCFHAKFILDSIASERDAFVIDILRAVIPRASLRVATLQRQPLRRSSYV